MKTQNYSIKEIILRKIICLGILSFVLGFSLIIEYSSISARETNENEYGNNEKNEYGDKGNVYGHTPFKSTLALTMNLYKGDTTYIGIRYISEDKFTAASSNPEVAAIDRDGKITALKCGKTDIIVTVTSQKRIKTLLLHVNVRISSYAKTASHGTPAKRKEGSGTRIIVHREVSSGASFKIRAKSEEEAEVSYSSSDTKVAEVSSEGVVTAKSLGKCVIKAKIENEVNAGSYSIVLYVKEPPKLEISNEEADDYFKDSAMAGNSIGVGLAMYCQRQYDGFLGNTVHLSKGCYSFMNDAAPITETSLHPIYNGQKYRVKDILNAMKIKKVFLSFGMNDLNIYGVSGSADEYKKFIKEIRKANPGIKVYIVSMTPVRKPSGSLENGNISTFNSLMKEYAEKTGDVYYIDIYSDLIDGTGNLKSEYCSDGFCHLTWSAYEKWAYDLKKFARQQIIKETKAGDAVAAALESHSYEDYKKAEELVDSLDKGALKKEYRGKLKGIF